MKGRMSHILVSIKRVAWWINVILYQIGPAGLLDGQSHEKFRKYVLSGAMDIMEPFFTPNSPNQLAIISFFLVLVLSSFGRPN